MFNSIFGSSKKATSEIETPSSLINYERINYERISRNDWMAENSIEGDLTPRLLFRASYKSELDYLRNSNPTQEELEMILSKRTPRLRLTREGDTENIGYVESLSFVADCEPKWFSAQPVLLPDGVTKDANFRRTKVLGGKVRMPEGDITNIIALLPDDGIITLPDDGTAAEEPQTGTIIHGFTDQEYNDFWREVETIVPATETGHFQNSDRSPPLSCTGAETAAHLCMLPSSELTAIKRNSLEIDSDCEDASNAGPSSTHP